ncbi:MAG: Sua5/YciO/YrdC/YwlC family protein, partial [Acidimicrobiia bacterium]|nr:Sua5/YciO/YrdC/YwlC family protein [Acidimicrobiia bacterium]
MAEQSHATGPEIEKAARILADGGLVAFPTETVYGLGADATSAEAVTRIFAAKGRPADHPLIVHIGSRDDLERFGADVPSEAARLVDA